MGKLAFIFPGQGAQYVGMGKDFYEEFPVCRKTIEKAAEISKLDLEKICFEENEKISITEYTQIAMTAVEAAILKALEEKGFYPDMTAGLSLGEYGALLASGAMSLEDIFYTVRKRGIYMQEAVPTGGAMVAVLGMEAELIGKICKETQGIVSVANYNCPGQIVITGEEGAVAKASEKLKEAGAKRILPLQVSGPFHCEMLTGAGEKLSHVLEEIPLRAIKIPYISNVTAQMVTEKEQIKDLLVKQVSSPVRWQQCVETMIENGADTFIEIGPGRTLSGFMRKINRNVTVMNIQTVEDFWKVTEKLRERREAMLENKVALVTGAGRGIGRQIALTLAKEGATVVVNYNGSKKRAEGVVEEIENAGCKAEAYGCDVSNFEGCQEMIDTIIKKYGHLDILVNNAGITRDGLIMKMKEEDFDAVLNTNLKGTFHTIRHSARQMLKQKSGKIINISSVSGVMGNAGQANYAASKAGVIGLTKTMARELASRGITVNAVAPGFIETEMTEVLSDSVKEHACEQIPLGRFGNAEDVAELVAFLASEKGNYITGQVLCVDGGMSI